MAESLSSAQLLMEEAKQRGLQVHSYEHIHLGYALLQHKNHREYIFQSQSNKLGRVTARLFTENKVLTTTILREAGFPILPDIITNSTREAEAFLHTHQRIVVKPIGSEAGKGVATNIQTPSALHEALEFAAAYNTDKEGRVVLQKHIDGIDVRVLVINQSVCVAMERIPAHVVGDGVQTIDSLLEQYNRQARPGYEIKKNSQMHVSLAHQSVNLESVPPEGKKIRLAGIANVHAGGTTRDITESIGQETKDTALRLARYFDCPLVGVDLISPDITKEPGYTIELNAAPDISIHQYPTHGQARNVAPLIIDMLFPETAKSV